MEKMRDDWDENVYSGEVTAKNSKTQKNAEKLLQSTYLRAIFEGNGCRVYFERSQSSFLELQRKERWGRGSGD